MDKQPKNTPSEEINTAGQRYREARELASQLNSSLQADDRRFCGNVHMHHRDGSTATWVNAFVHEHGNDILMVFTEHHGFFVYPRDEVAIQYWPWKMDDTKVFGARWPMKDI